MLIYNIMKIKSLILFLCFCINANSQDTTRKIEITKEEFIYACNEYKKMIETNAYLDNEKKTRNFADKIGDLLNKKNLPLDSLKNKKMLLQLISENIKITKFKTIEEAEICLDDMLSSGDRLEKENKHLYELMSRATPEQKRKIVQPFFNRVKSELEK